MADLALRPLSLGELLDRAFTIFRQRFGAILLTLAVTFLFPLLLLTNNIRSLVALAPQLQTPSSPEASMQLMFAIMGKLFLIGVVFLVAMVVGKGAVLWISHKAMLGDEADAWSSLGRAFKAFFPLLGLAIVEIIIFFGVELVLYIPAVILGAGGMAAGGRPGTAFGVGVLVYALVVMTVMVYVSAALFVTTSVLVAEVDAGVFGAIRRSWELTGGRRGNIVGMLVLVTILLWIVMFGLSFVVGLVAGMAGRGGGPEAAGGLMVATFGLMGLFGVLVTGFFNVLQMTTYYDLRIRKEGLDLELASAAMPAA